MALRSAAIITQHFIRDSPRLAFSIASQTD